VHLSIFIIHAEITGDDILKADGIRTRSSLTTPRAAAIAGILFSLLLITSLVLIRISVPANPQDVGDWLTKNSGRVNLALNLLPFAGVAFLWFIGVVRDRLGENEDRFFATVFLGSGLLFLAMLFTSAAIAGGVISLYGVSPGALVNSNVYTFGRVISYEIMTVYTMKMAGVFMISTCTLSLRTGIFPRWMAYLGLVLALILLLTVSLLYWAPLVFPMWVLLISVHILMVNLRKSSNESTTPAVS
jgi:hypothetical protein